MDAKGIANCVADVNSRYVKDAGQKKCDCKHQGFRWNSILGTGRYTCGFELRSDGNCVVKEAVKECDKYEK